MAAPISITALDPNSEVPKSSIEAVVTLVWPYSSSTGQIAVLLAEKDFRLRSSRGQVRVRFTGAAGKAIALKHIGATDVVTLRLDGARWVEPLETVRTPGRSVEADLHFSNQVDVMIQRESGQIEHVQVHSDPSTQTASTQKHVDPTPSTPRTNVASLSLTTPQQSKSQSAWRSPSLNLKPDTNLFLDIDEFAPVKKKSRTSYSSVKAWRYDDGSNDVATVIDGEASDGNHVAVPEQEKAVSPLATPSVEAPIKNGANANVSDPATHIASMLPPPPKLKLAATDAQIPQHPPEEHVDRAADPSTPKLIPVATSSLPLPSPFPNETLQEPFAGVLASSDRENRSKAQTLSVDVAKDDATKKVNAKSKITTAPVAVAADTIASRKPDAGKTSISESRPMKQTLASLFGLPSSSQVTNGGSPTPSQTATEAVLSDFELARSVLPERSENDAGENLNKDVQRRLSVTNTSESANKNVNSTSGELDVRLPQNNANTITSRRSSKLDTHIQARNDAQTALQPSKQSTKLDTTSKSALPQSTKQHATATPLDRPADSAAIDAMARRGSSIRAFFKRDSASGLNAQPVDHPSLAAPTTSTSVATAQKIVDSANPSSSDKTTTRQDTELDDVPQLLSAELQPESNAQHIFNQQFHGAEVVKNGDDEGQSKRSSRESAPAASDPPHRIQENGFRTVNSYFTALSAITAYMNRNQPGSGIVDVLVAVTTGTKQPQRAESGPKDYYTSFRVADQSLQSQQNTRVDIFRPRKGPLPSVAPGDVVLLRDFAVKSDKHDPYLLSTGQSSWCVWRFSKLYGTIGSKKLRSALANTQWHDKYRSLEEITGIPVEYGQDERFRALKMWHWWLASRSLEDGDADQNS